MAALVAMRADPGLPAGAHQADRQAVLEHEQVGGPDAEHHQRVAIEPVFEPAPARARQIFAHRQRVDIADAAALEIARGRMMNGMGSPPEIVRRQGQHAEHAADPIVRTLARKEGAMAAIVLDHEQAHEEAGGRNGDQQRDPPIAVGVSQRAATQRTTRETRVITSSMMPRRRLGSR